MEFSSRYKLNPVERPLTEQERLLHLEQKVLLDLHPHYQLCVIKMNSTYLESVDKHFGWKGASSAVALVVILMFLSLYLGLIHVSMNRDMNSVATNDDSFVLIAAAGMIAPLVVAAVWILRRESFAYTHYPMRFNRKTRMVHVFRKNGTVLSVSWDSLYFTLGKIANTNEWEVRGHVINSSNKAVCETFSLSYTGFLPTEFFSVSTTRPHAEDFLRAHWEFIRRYMEDGPGAVTGQIQFCMPVDKRRESFFVGAERIFANIAGAPFVIYWIMSPICLIVSLSRWFAMRTSKLPRWPHDIEATCSIEPNDSHAIEGAPDGTRVAVFLDAASTAGVCFSGTAHPATSKKNFL